MLGCDGVGMKEVAGVGRKVRVGERSSLGLGAWAGWGKRGSGGAADGVPRLLGGRGRMAAAQERRLSCGCRAATAGAGRAAQRPLTPRGGESLVGDQSTKHTRCGALRGTRRGARRAAGCRQCVCAGRRPRVAKAAAAAQQPPRERAAWWWWWGGNNKQRPWWGVWETWAWAGIAPPGVRHTQPRGGSQAEGAVCRLQRPGAGAETGPRDLQTTREKLLCWLGASVDLAKAVRVTAMRLYLVVCLVQLTMTCWLCTLYTCCRLEGCCCAAEGDGGRRRWSACRPSYHSLHPPPTPRLHSRTSRAAEESRPRAPC